MAHAKAARQLRDEFEAITGIRPKYPRSRVALQGQRETLDRYIAAKSAVNTVKARRQAEKDFADEFTRMGAIDLVDDFDLDTETNAGQLGGEAGRLLRRAKTQHRREGAAHVFSTWRQETRDPYDLGDTVVNDNIRIRGGNVVTDYTLTAERAAEALQKIEGEYLLKVKFLREQAPDVWVYEDGFAPLRQGRDRGGNVFEVTSETQPGALEGIDRLFYTNAYPVSAVVYGLYPVREPNVENLEPMRDGDLNCVARRVLEHFERARRGQGLTASRRQKIDAWEAEVHANGATLQDVAGLERILKRPIVVRDITGADLYNSGKYRACRWVDIELTLHNGHAWGSDLHFPQSREVQIYKGNVWQAIAEATQKEPMAVWLLGSTDNKRLTVDQFVLGDGRTFRTQETHDRLLRLCQHLEPEDPEALARKVFGENHAASVVARERNDWKPTPVNLLDMVQSACVEHGHGGLWNAADYNVDDVVSIDMRACYPASFQGQGEAAPWFQRFGHPKHRMTRVAVNGPLPEDIGTGFAQVRAWEFADGIHPVIGAWFGSHFHGKQWAPTALLAYMRETGLLTRLEVTEAIIAFETQKEVWLPESNAQGRALVGKFTQGSKAGGKRLTRRLVTDEGELDFLVRDTRQSGTLVGAPERCPAGWILTYYDGSQPQYAHLRASTLCYAHINMLAMLRRFTPEEAVRVATDSIYVQKTALHKLSEVSAFVAKKKCNCGEVMCIPCMLEEEYLPPVAPAQWRDKGEKIDSAKDHAAYQPKPEYRGSALELPDSTAPSHKDPLTRHALAYINGGGGSGKTTRAIELFRARKPLVFTPTHRLAKEMRTRGVEAQTYHSFFRWSGQRQAVASADDLRELHKTSKMYKGRPLRVVYRSGDEDLALEGHGEEVVFDAIEPGSRLLYPIDDLVMVEYKTGQRHARRPGGPRVADPGGWAADRMGQKFVPRVIIWDEVCTVPRPVLETFLAWLGTRGAQVVCCGDQGQPPPIAGEAPHDWLRAHVNYYEEVEADYRAKDPALKGLKKAIRLQPDRIQCREMRRSLPRCLGWDRFMEAWKPGDLILTSRQKVRERAQHLLFVHHRKAYPNEPVPLLYRPEDTRRQNIMVTIPGPLLLDERPDQQELVLNDVVEASVQTAQEVIDGKWGPDWALGYSMTVHSSQGLTIEEPQKVWIVDDYLQWSNLAYLAVSRVQYLHQLARCCPPPNADGPPPPAYDETAVRKNIGRKLQAYTRVDQAEGLMCNLRIKDVEALKGQQGNHCAACNIELLWCYAPKDSRQFIVDRIDKAKGHTRDNVRLTCLECNRTAVTA